MQSIDDIFNDIAHQKRERVKVEVPNVFSDYWNNSIVVITLPKSSSDFHILENTLRRHLINNPDIEDCSYGKSYFSNYEKDIPFHLKIYIEFNLGYGNDFLKTVISFNSHFNFEKDVQKFILNVLNIFDFRAAIVFINRRLFEDKIYLSPYEILKIVKNEFSEEYEDKLKKIMNILK